MTILNSFAWKAFHLILTQDYQFLIRPLLTFTLVRSAELHVQVLSRDPGNDQKTRHVTTTVMSHVRVRTQHACHVLLPFWIGVGKYAASQAAAPSTLYVEKKTSAPWPFLLIIGYIIKYQMLYYAL